MKLDPQQHLGLETPADLEAALVELTLEDLEAVAGGPQIINDGPTPP
jgi:hypothetical protein